MANRAQIDRIAQRVEALAERAASRTRKIVTITQAKDRGETEEEATNKYFAAHPEDIGSDVILIVCV